MASIAGVVTVITKNPNVIPTSRHFGIVVCLATFGAFRGRILDINWLGAQEGEDNEDDKTL